MPDQPEVKGPDPAVWGEEQCDPANIPEFVDTRENVKGPDPEVWGEAQCDPENIPDATPLPGGQQHTVEIWN